MYNVYRFVREKETLTLSQTTKATPGIPAIVGSKDRGWNDTTVNKQFSEGHSVDQQQKSLS